jgi:hypothetical protein
VRVVAVAVCLLSCGRIGFDASEVTWVQSFAHSHIGSGTQQSVEARALASGDAVVLAATCTTSTAQTGVTVSAPGWTFAPVTPLDGAAAAVHWAASFGAIAPDTAHTVVTATWDLPCDTGMTLFADEFANAAQGGGTSTFDNHAEDHGAGACTATVATSRPGEIVWGVCDAFNHASAPGPGYTKGADDGVGDFAEYKVSTGATETLSYVGGSKFVALVVTIAPL